MRRTIELLIAASVLLAASVVFAGTHRASLSVEPTPFPSATLLLAQMTPPPPPPLIEAPPPEQMQGQEQQPLPPEQQLAPSQEPPPVQWAGPASRRALEDEYAELEANTPDIALPIVLDALGLGGFFVGYVGVLFGAVMGADQLFLAGLAVAGCGIAAGIVGTILLVKAIIGRITRTRRMNAINDQLRDMEVPPPMAPPGQYQPSAHLGGGRLEPRLVLARF